MTAGDGLRIEGVTVRYGRAVALSDVSMTVPEGRMTGLVGRNGAGKSTLLNAVSGVLKIESGTIGWRGADLHGRSPHEIVSAGVVQVPEGRRLFPDLTVQQNLDVGAIATRRSPTEHIDGVLDVFPELRPMLRRPAGGLSGGEQQMVAIGRGLMASPGLLMVDELSLGLAPKLAQRLVEALAELAATRRLGILLVDQNVRLLEGRVGGFSVISQGTIVHSGEAGGLADAAAIDAYMGWSPGRGKQTGDRTASPR